MLAFIKRGYDGPREERIPMDPMNVVDTPRALGFSAEKVNTTYVWLFK